MAKKAETPEHTQEAATVMTSDHLKYRPDLQTGGKILGGKGTLVRMPELEGRDFFVPPSSDLIVPNPVQPRTYFDPVKMEELMGTIREVGQLTPIEVVPFFDGRRIRFLILNGERRFRVVRDLKLPYARISIKWSADEEVILYKSLIVNESNAPHNPMERANAYQRMIHIAESRGIKSPIPHIAKKLGLSAMTIHNHLKLLTLPPNIQDMVAKGTLPQGNALFLAQAQKKYGDSLGLMRLARVLVDDPGRDLSEGGKEVRLTRDAMRNELSDLLLAGGHGEEAARLQMQKTVVTFLGNLSRVSSGGRKIAGEQFERVVVDTLRNRGRGEPPEVVRDTLDAVAGLLAKIRTLVDKAIAPDPLPEMPGRPKFAQYLEQLKLRFGDIRYRMAILFAKASDSGGQILTVGKLCEQLAISAQDVSSNMSYLSRELGMIGIDLDKHWVREKARDGHYEEKPAYRMAWAKDGYIADPSRSRAAPVPPRLVAPATPPSEPKVAPVPTPSRGFALPPTPTPPPSPARPAPAPAVVREAPPAGPPAKFLPLFETPLARETFKKFQDELVIAITLVNATDKGTTLTADQLFEQSGLTQKRGFQDKVEQARVLLSRIGVRITRGWAKDERKQERSGYRLEWSGDPATLLEVARQPKAQAVVTQQTSPGTGERKEAALRASFDVRVKQDGLSGDMQRRIGTAGHRIGELLMREISGASFAPGTEYGDGLCFYIMRRETDGAILVRSNLVGPGNNLFSSFEKQHRDKVAQIIAANLGDDAGRVNVIFLNAGPDASRKSARR